MPAPACPASTRPSIEALCLRNLLDETAAKFYFKDLGSRFVHGQRRPPAAVRRLARSPRSRAAATSTTSPASTPRRRTRSSSRSSRPASRCSTSRSARPGRTSPDTWVVSNKYPLRDDDRPHRRHVRLQQGRDREQAARRRAAGADQRAAQGRARAAQPARVEPGRHRPLRPEHALPVRQPGLPATARPRRVARPRLVQRRDRRPAGAGAAARAGAAPGHRVRRGLRGRVHRAGAVRGLPAGPDRARVRREPSARRHDERVLRRARPDHAQAGRGRARRAGGAGPADRRGQPGAAAWTGCGTRSTR